MKQFRIKYLPLAFNRLDAEGYVGTPQLFADMLAAGWIKTCQPTGWADPSWNWRKPVLFDRRDLEAACERYRAGEVPKIG